MAALFIKVEVEAAVAQDAALVKKLVEVCPVNIFAQAADQSLALVEQNLDECTLCELCLEVGPPGAVRVTKCYGEGETLRRQA